MQEDYPGDGCGHCSPPSTMDLISCPRGSEISLQQEENKGKGAKEEKDQVQWNRQLNSQGHKDLTLSPPLAPPLTTVQGNLNT